jgi:ABC-type polar amino acid transport system ATPase subunit
VKTLNGHFDGKVVVLDEPANLKPNTRVKIIAESGSGPSNLITNFTTLSEPVFEKIWDNSLDADYDTL